MCDLYTPQLQHAQTFACLLTAAAADGSKHAVPALRHNAAQEAVAAGAGAALAAVCGAVESGAAWPGDAS